MLVAVCHSSELGWRKVGDLEELSELRKEEGNLLWVETNVEDLTPEDIETIAEEFGLHPLAVADATNTRQRPKLENYEKHLFVVLHQLDEVAGQLEAVQLACFVGERYVLTIHHGADRTIEDAKERWRELEGKLDHGPSELIHTLLDVIVDCFEEHANNLEDEVERIEDVALSRPTIPMQKDLYTVKQRVARLRRYAFPVGRIVDSMVTPGESQFIQIADPLYFRDVADHIMRINDQVRNVNDLASAVLDLVRNEQANALNENQRRLSAWAAIFAVSTLIAGVYGMNFELVPEDGSLFGFWFAVALMVVLTISLYAYFKAREWL